MLRLLRASLIEFALLGCIEAQQLMTKLNKQFGNDAIKVHSCIKLFASVSDEPVFKKIINKYHW